MKLLLVIVTLLYPFAVYFGLQEFSPRIVGLLVLLIAGCRLLLPGLGNAQRWGLGLILAGVTLPALMLNSQTGLLLYPLAVNGMMAALFVASLFAEQSAIERLARLHEPELDENGVRYTRRLTMIWIGFFIANGCAAALTVWQWPQYWLIYNGLIAYLLMGTLFVGELAIRPLIRERQHG